MDWEFHNKKFKDFLEKNKVHHFSTFNEDIKCAIVERFNATLKNKIYKYLTSKNTKKYINVLNNIVNAYNKTKHSSTKFKPINVNLDNKNKVFSNIHDGKSMRQILKEENKIVFQEGDFVRLAKLVKNFQKRVPPIVYRRSI